MMLPTVSGLFSAPGVILGLTAESAAVEPQVATDAFYSGAVISAIGISWRTRSVIRKQLGEAALAKYKQGLVAGII